MSAAQLLSDLARLGIHIEAHGDRLRFSPRSAVTPDLADRMKAHKSDLLAVLRGDTEAPANPPTTKSADDLLDELTRRGGLLWLNDAGRLTRENIPSNLVGEVSRHESELTRILRVEAAKIAQVKALWQTALDRLEGDPLFPPDVMEALRAAEPDDPEAGETDEAIEMIDPPDPCPKCGTLELWQSLAGNWRCLRCDPPTKARRLRERAARLKTDRTDSPRMNARGDP